MPGRTGPGPCSPGKVVLCPPEGGWEQERKDVLTQMPVCASLISLTYHLHLTKDIILTEMKFCSSLELTNTSLTFLFYLTILIIQVPPG